MDYVRKVAIRRNVTMTEMTATTFQAGAALLIGWVMGSVTRNVIIWNVCLMGRTVKDRRNVWRGVYLRWLMMASVTQNVTM